MLLESLSLGLGMFWAPSSRAEGSRGPPVAGRDKTSPGSLAVHTGGGSSSTSAGLTAGSTPNIFAAASATPKSMINTTGATDAAPSSSSSSSFVNGATSKNLPAVQTVAPMPEDTEESMSAFCEVDQCSLRQGQTPPELKPFSSLTGLQAASRDAGHITTKLERALEKVAPLLREIFVDFAPFLSRTLLGSHGQELLIEGLVCMKSSTSVVELVMLLCSQPISLASGAHKEAITWCLFVDPDCRARASRRLIATIGALWYPQSKALFSRELSLCYMEAIIQGLSSKKKKSICGKWLFPALGFIADESVSMLLKEWQNSIQKNAGLAFIELINEGRLLCHAMKDHIVRVANEAEFILNRQRAEDVHKHADFESNCAQYAADRKEDEKMCDHLISAAKHRDHVTANQLKQKIVNILTNKHSAWGTLAQSNTAKHLVVVADFPMGPVKITAGLSCSASHLSPASTWSHRYSGGAGSRAGYIRQTEVLQPTLHDFWRLDYWEDDLRRRRRFVRNPFGSTHLDVTCKSLQEYGTEEDEVVKSKKVFRIQTVASQNPETELMLEGDEDAVSLLQEKEMDNMGGPVVLSSPAQLVAPVLVARGTLSITTTEIYFEVDEDDPAFKSVDSKMSSSSIYNAYKAYKNKRP
ncbi:hypothetical protein JOQ06_016882 [Pogonophryne albipinna]|uniref:BEACH-type PH domain-containing protein n=1 Tax=Pogonophryne albipinna TaxID=1090488 RepID=A0AAD6FIN1_9TELE|nr:hypothetical protein JOQ06_016882 [Pogonophryne albipinna]